MAISVLLKKRWWYTGAGNSRHGQNRKTKNFRITALQSKSLRKFFKKECVNEKTGEILDSSKIRAFVDFDKVAEYKKSLGYYQIVTSELTMDAQEVIDKYHGLTQIMDQLILNAFGICLPPKLYRRAELKHFKTEIKVFM